MYSWIVIQPVRSKHFAQNVTSSNPVDTWRYQYIMASLYHQYIIAFKKIKYTHSQVALKKKKYRRIEISVNIIRISDSEYKWVVTAYKSFLLTIFQCWSYIKYNKKVITLEHTLLFRIFILIPLCIKMCVLSRVKKWSVKLKNCS